MRSGADDAGGVGEQPAAGLPHVGGAAAYYRGLAVKQELAGLETALDKTAKKLEEGQNALHTTKRYTARLQKQLEAVQLLDEEDKHDKEQ